MARAIAVRRDRRGLLASAGSGARLFVDLSPLALAGNSLMPDPDPPTGPTSLVAALVAILRWRLLIGLGPLLSLLPVGDRDIQGKDRCGDRGC